MKVAIIFLMVSFTLVIESETSKDYLTAFIIKVAIETALNQAKRIGHVVLLHDFSLTIPTIFNQVITGGFEVQNVTLYGLSTLKYHDTVNVDKEVEKNVTVKTYNVNINSTLDKIGIRSAYGMDFGIIGFLPIYGNGEIQLELNDVDVKVNVTLNDRNKLRVEDLRLELSFSCSNETYITGFWKNKRISKYLTKVMNILERFLYIWFKESRACLECVTSRIVQFVVNFILVGKGIKYEKCSCSEENDISLITPLENFFENLDNKDVIEMLQYYLNPDRIRKLIKNIKGVIGYIVRRENNLETIFI